MEEKQSILKRCMLVIALSVLCILSCFMIAKPKEAQAASSYKEIFTSDKDYTKPTKVGKYYYKYKTSTGRVYYSKKKKSGYHKTNLTRTNGLWTNGKNIYYIDNNYTTNPTLYRYNISKKTTSTIKNLGSSVKHSYDSALKISKFYGGKIYFTAEDEYDWCARTYYYDKSSKKVKKVKSNCAIIASSGKYCVARKQHISEYDPVTLTLYKITSSGGLKKIKTLTKKGAPDPTVTIKNKKIYYAAYSSYKMKKFTVYRVNRTGKSRKKLTTVKTSALTYVNKITSKSVKYTVYDYSKGSNGVKTHTKKY